MKICLVGLLYDRNMGDPLLFDCTRYLLNEVYHSDLGCKISAEDDLVIEYVDFEKRTGFAPQNSIDFCEEPILREKHSVAKSVLGEGLYGFLKDIKNYVRRCRCIQNSKSSIYRQELDKYYKERFKGSDMVVIIGAGTLKYHVRADFGGCYEAIIDACSDLNIPVVVSCVGVESPYNRLDPRCARFVECLNKGCVKYITTRDGLNHLRPYVKKADVGIAKCADVGVYASQTYNVSKNVDSKVVGIGIITYKRFVEFARGITKEQYEKTILEVIKALEETGRKWLFFNNGDNEDASYQAYLCNKFGYSASKMMKTPESPKELVVNISKLGGDYVKTAFLYSFLFIRYTLCSYSVERQIMPLFTEYKSRRCCYQERKNECGIYH